MVELVEPLFQSLARSTVSPRLPGEQEFLPPERQGGFGGFGGAQAAVPSFAGLAAPQTSGGGSFADRLGSNPLFLAGMAGLSGGNPLQAIHQAQVAQAKQQERALRLQILQREEQRATLEFQQAQESRQLLGGLIANIPDEETRDAAVGIFATGEMGKLAEFFEKSTDPVVIEGQVFDRRALARAAKIAGAGGVDKSQNKQILLQNGLDERKVDVAERNASTSERGAALRGEELGVRREELAEKRKQGNSREREIRDNMGTFRLSRQDATDLVDGNVEIKTNPQTGDQEIVNKRTNQAQQVEFQQQFVPEGEGRGSKDTVFGDLQNTFGPKSAFARIINDSVALLPVFGGLTDTQASAAKTRVGVLKEDIIDAFAKSGRPPVVEQQRLLELLPSTGLFQNPDTAESSLTELYGQLVDQRRQDLVDSQDRTLPAKERAQLRVRANDVTRILQRLGTPRETTPNRPALPKTREDFDRLPSGSYFIDPGNGALKQKQ